MHETGVLRAVVFDLDGTLVDSAPDIAWSINRMLAGHGLSAIPVRDVEKLTGEGASVLVERVLAQAGVVADAARVARDTETYLAQYRARPCEDSILFADAKTAIPALKRAGLALGVCTNKPEHLAVLVLRELGLLRDIDVVVGADTTTARKPDKLPLLHTLRALGVEPGQTVYVGDTQVDRDCAAAAGVACRLVEWRVDRVFDLAGASEIDSFAALLA